MPSDQSSLSFQVGHYHVQFTGVDMHIILQQMGKKLVKSKMDYYKSYLNFL